MNKTRLLPLIPVLLAPLFSGCLLLVGVGAGALAVHSTGKDSYEGTWNASFNEAYLISKDVIREDGTIQDEDRTKGLIKGRIYGTITTIKITRKDERIHIKVSSRKNIAAVSPAPETAKRIIDKIKERVEGEHPE